MGLYYDLKRSNNDFPPSPPSASVRGVPKAPVARQGRGWGTDCHGNGILTAGEWGTDCPLGNVVEFVIIKSGRNSVKRFLESEIGVGFLPFWIDGGLCFSGLWYFLCFVGEDMVCEL